MRIRNESALFGSPSRSLLSVIGEIVHPCYISQNGLHREKLSPSERTSQWEVVDTLSSRRRSLGRDYECPSKIRVPERTSRMPNDLENWILLMFTSLLDADETSPFATSPFQAAPLFSYIERPKSSNQHHSRIATHFSSFLFCSRERACPAIAKLLGD